MDFKNWLNLQESSAGRPANKSGLYPLGYGGIGLYPELNFIPRAADAITYMTMDKRLKGHDGPPHDITHLPGKASTAKGNTTSLPIGDGSPWKIDHL
jgi:hypothetical protein